MSEDHIAVAINGVLYVKFEDAKKLREGWDKADAEIEKLRAALKEYDDAFEDWFLFVEGRKDDPNEETKACTRLVKAQRVARAALGEKE